MDTNDKDPAALEPPSSSMPVKGISLGLSRITSLLSRLGQPHLSVPIVHVAGTNGKGSVCSYIDSILRSSGLRVGRYTSPHLIHVRDCITINGTTICSSTYESAKNAVEAADSEGKVGASSFEQLTATAFLAFKETKPPLDVAVIEVGLGGTDDATNVCPNPLVSVITAVDLDHQALLGNTVAEIASVKAGIIKPGRPCILAPQSHAEAVQAVENAAKAAQADLKLVKPAEPVSGAKEAAVVHTEVFGDIMLELPLPGKFQLANVATAVAAVETLHKLEGDRQLRCDITAQSVQKGVKNTRWPGRLDWLDLTSSGSSGTRQVLLDGAHNPASIVALREYLDSLDEQPTTFILALSTPRQPETLLRPLLEGFKRISNIVAVEFSLPEGMPWVKPVDKQTLANEAEEMGFEACTADSVGDALKKAGEGDRIVFCGSLYLAADVYRYKEAI